MELARVLGSVVSTVKYKGLENVKMLLIQPLDHNLFKVGDPIVATDPGKSGEGDLVYWVGGREATHPLPVKFVPVDACIVGIVDQVSLK